MTLQELIEKNERELEETLKHSQFVNHSKIKSHLHASQVSIVEWLKEQLKDLPQGHTQDGRHHWIDANDINPIIKELNNLQ